MLSHHLLRSKVVSKHPPSAQDLLLLPTPSSPHSAQCKGNRYLPILTEHLHSCDAATIMSYNHQLAFFKLSSTAVIPLRATVDSVGYDLWSKDNGVKQNVPAHGKALIELGLRVFIPKNCYGRIAPRSSLSWTNHTIISAGVIDPGYKGELSVVIFNHGDTDLEILPGQRIAQLILERCETPPVYQAVKDPRSGDFVFILVDDIDSIRNEGGFGSTGKEKLMDEQQKETPDKKSPSPPPPPPPSSCPSLEEGEIEEDEGKEDQIIIDDTYTGEFRITKENEEKAKTPKSEKPHRYIPYPLRIARRHCRGGNSNRRMSRLRLSLMSASRVGPSS